MRGLTYGLAALVLATTVGCGGARVADLESELSACKENKTTLSAENAKLQEDNAKLQARSDELAKIAEARKALHDDLQSALLPLIDAGKLSISIRNGMVSLAVPSETLFDPGKATLKKDARETLVTVAGAIKNLDHKFLIAGHTDSVPVKEKKAKYHDNWELTSAQAFAVYQIVSAAGVTRQNLAVAGFGEADPVGDNGTDEGKAKNRRVEIIVMPNMEAVLPAVAQVQPKE